MRARVDDPAGRGDAVEARHVEVHQHHVRLERERLGHRLVARLGLADERQAPPASRAAPRGPTGIRRGRRRPGSGSARPSRLGRPRCKDQAAAGRRPACRRRAGARRGTPRRARRPARASTASPTPARAARGKPTAVVLDDDRQVVAAGEAERAARRASVADGVGHRLGADPVRGDLDRGGQVGQTARRPRRRAFGAPGRLEAIGGEPERADEADLVDRRRPQRVDEPADVGDGGRDTSAWSSAMQLRGPLRVVAHEASRRPRPASRCAASAGPRPSCRSRRSRRRSSSRAVTSRSREARRSSVSSAACAATPIWLGEIVEQPEVGGRQRVGRDRAARRGAGPSAAPGTSSGRSMTSSGRVAPLRGEPGVRVPDPARAPTYGSRSASATVSTTTRGIDVRVDAQPRAARRAGGSPAPARRDRRRRSRVAARWRASRIGSAASAAIPVASSEVANTLAEPSTAPRSPPRRRRRR